MRLPSIDLILKNLVYVVNRFPFASAAAVIGTIAAWALTREVIAEEKLLPYQKWLLTALLALPWFIAANIYTTYAGKPRKVYYILSVIIIAALTVFYFTIPETVSPKTLIRFGLLFVAGHLLVASAGFVHGGSTSAFWHFNKALFIRIVTAGIFSGALFAGLAGALAALRELFNLALSDHWFPRIFITVAGIFNTFFFLSGVPESQEELETNQTYPPVLKIFTQYVLVPLVSIYLVILLAYEAKILVSWSLPKGWVSNLIIAYGIAGMLSILLVYPLRSTEGQKWIKVFAKWFYVLLLPLVILMLIAIGKRIGDYSFTEERLIVLAVAIWLGAMAIYFLWKSSADIRIIPLSLAALCIFLSLTIFTISEQAQHNRLTSLLQKNGLLKENSILATNNEKAISFKDRKSISSITEYLYEMHGRESLQPPYDVSKLSDGANRRSTSMATTELLKQAGLGYTGRFVNEDGTTPAQQVHLYAQQYSLPVSGYDSLIVFDSKRPAVNGSGYRIAASPESFAILYNNQIIAEKIVPASLLDPEKYYPESPIDPAQFKQVVQAAGYDIVIYYTSISADARDKGGYRVHHYAGIMLVKKL